MFALETDNVTPTAVTANDGRLGEKQTRKLYITFSLGEWLAPQAELMNFSILVTIQFPYVYTARFALRLPSVSLSFVCYVADLGNNDNCIYCMWWVCTFMLKQFACRENVFNVLGGLKGPFVLKVKYKITINCINFVCTYVTFMYIHSLILSLVSYSYFDQTIAVV